MRSLRLLLLVSGIVLVAIQFVRPGRNKNEQVSDSDISKVLSVPDSVLVMLHNTCYDCHSNNTRYPWYSNIQPVGWLLARDISRGKKQLNFNEFGEYIPRRQLSKLEGIADNVRDNTMPLKSYRLIHRSARLNENEKRLLINWAERSIDRFTTTK